MSHGRLTAAGVAAAFWGVLGLATLFGFAVWRLLPQALEPIRDGVDPAEGGLYAASLLLMGWSEGYAAFQKRYAPRVAVRAMHLARHGRPLQRLLAPLFCMALFHANRRQLSVSWGVIAAVWMLVVLVRWLPHPWHGAVDAGVVLGLVWGIASTLLFFAFALAGRAPHVSPECPAHGICGQGRFPEDVRRTIST